MKKIVLEHSPEIYGGIIALRFSTLGIWLGLALTRETWSCGISRSQS